MEYQKTVNLLNNESNQLSKFRTKNWVEINDDVKVYALLINKLDLKQQC